jgi:hypothetical protein
MKDIRGAAKREDEYYRSHPIQHCRICRRPFIRRKGDDICSIACLEKSKEQPAGNGAGRDPRGAFLIEQQPCSTGLTTVSLSSAEQIRNGAQKRTQKFRGVRNRSAV